MKQCSSPAPTYGRLCENFDDAKYLSLYRWELIIDEAKAVRNITYFEQYEAPYISIHGMFPLKRRMLPEISATRNPCILIMLLTLSIYWLPTNSSMKVILGAIVFLALVILLVYVAWRTKFPMGAVLAGKLKR